MRYKGQHHSIKISVIETDDTPRLRTHFDQEYLRRYGHINPAADVEIVVLHSLATLHMQRPDIARLAKSADGHKAKETGSRPVFFLEEEGFLPTRIYDRYGLKPGFKASGPALIVEYGSSTLVGSRDDFTIGMLGEIDIDCHP
jgi:N-methylhydantoinase A/oxoprolinase/acetone carboxylase beta subunit